MCRCIQIAHLVNLEDGVFPYLITQRMLLVSLHILWALGTRLSFVYLVYRANSATDGSLRVASFPDLIPERPHIYDTYASRIMVRRDWGVI